MDATDQWLWEKHLGISDPRVKPVFEADPGFRLASTRLDLREHDGSPLVISRLDSDDLVSSNYLDCVNTATIQLEKRGQAGGLVISCLGHITDGAFAQKAYIPNSPFISLYCHQYSGENIYSFPHQNVLKLGVPCVLDRQSRWIQFLHGSNVANQFILKNLVSPDQFPARISSSPTSSFAAVLEPAETGWPRGFPFPIA